MNGREDKTRLLESDGMGFSVGEKRILHDVSFSLGRGELVGVIGPNGAGKTTLLRLASGLLPPSSGSVSFSGEKLAALRPRTRARLVSFMSQDIPQEISFSVLEVVLMGRYPHLARFQRESAEDIEKARRMLAYVGLSGFEERPFGELSGGERQLALFARVLAQEAELVVLDEPSSHLDLRHEDAIFSMAQELAREGRGVLASVHNLNVASHYCGRLILLDRGMVAAAGKAEEVLAPALLQRVYGVKAIVSRSAATGSVMVSVVPLRVEGRGVRIHLIGGAGSAVNLTRELYRLGFALTGGIAHARDSDEALWKSLGIECFSVDAFSRISDRDVEHAAARVEAAELVILCAFPIGLANVANLRLAARARRLVILEPGPGDLQRSYFTDDASRLFEALGKSAETRKQNELVSELVGGA